MENPSITVQIPQDLELKNNNQGLKFERTKCKQGYPKTLVLLLGPPKDQFKDPSTFILKDDCTPFKVADVYLKSLEPHGDTLDKCIVADALPCHLWVPNKSSGSSPQKGGKAENSTLTTARFDFYKRYLHSIIESTSPEVICFSGHFCWIIALGVFPITIQNPSSGFAKAIKKLGVKESNLQATCQNYSNDLQGLFKLNGSAIIFQEKKITIYFAYHPDVINCLFPDGKFKAVLSSIFDPQDDQFTDKISKMTLNERTDPMQKQDMENQFPIQEKTPEDRFKNIPFTESDFSHLRSEIISLSGVVWVDLCTLNMELVLAVCVLSTIMDIPAKVRAKFELSTLKSIRLDIIERKVENKERQFDNPEIAMKVWVQSNMQQATRALFHIHSNLEAIYLQHSKESTSVVFKVKRKGYIPFGESSLPTEMCGLQTHVESGTVVSIAGPSTRAIYQENKPVFIGMSIGVLSSKASDQKAGTLGAFLSTSEGKVFAATARHVLTNNGKEDINAGMEAPAKGDLVGFPIKVTSIYLPFAKSPEFAHCVKHELYENIIEVSLDIGLVSIPHDQIQSTQEAFYCTDYDDHRYIQDATIVSIEEVFSKFTVNDKLIYFGRSSGFEESLQIVSPISYRPPQLVQGAEKGMVNIQTTQNYMDYTMLNQYLICGHSDKKNDQICAKGDSGSLLSLVRLSEENDHFITSPVGFLVNSFDDYLYAIATPIEPILSYFRESFDFSSLKFCFESL